MISSILVICIGNICRSPIGEAMFKNRLAHIIPTVDVSSAGLGAMVGHNADPISQELMLAKGIDISEHKARQITSEIAFASDLILTMSTEQQQQVESKFPSLRGRVHRIGKWGEFDVPDPFKRPKEIFEQAFYLIEQGVDEWYRTLWT